MELLEYASSMCKSNSGKTDAVHVIIFVILLQSVETLGLHLVIHIRFQIFL
jgi:hypothetical protein